MLIYTDKIWLGFAEAGSAASVVQTKQHNMKPTNRKKNSERSLLWIKQKFVMKEQYK